MGWSYCGKDSTGRDIGYGIEATCDHPTCTAKIDRGLDYACGGQHLETDKSCGKYFCPDHKSYVKFKDGEYLRLCAECEKLAYESGKAEE